MENTKKPQAYPTLFYNQTSGEPNGHDAGMTLRDHFAGLAMQGHLASYYGAGVHCDQENMGYLAKSFYDMADEMLKQREM
jgi:hypothetical protein